MEILIIYLVFSYLFMLGIMKSCGDYNIVILIISPIILPILLGVYMNNANEYFKKHKK